MRTRSFVFPSLLALALCVSNVAQADSSGTSLVQPAFAFSENSAAVIKPASDNVLFDSDMMESEDSELGNGSFINAPLGSAKPLRSWSTPTAPQPDETAPCLPSACLPSACEPVCEPCGPSPCVCSSCESYCDGGCGCVTSAQFGRFGAGCFASSRFKFGDFGPRCGGGSQFFMSAWLSAGATLPSRSPKRDVEAVNRFPDIYNEFIMNQLYFTVGRNVNTNRNAIDIGGRLDLLYGTDYYFTSALGLETKTSDPWGRPIWDLDPKKAAASWNSSDGPRNGGHASKYGLSMPQLYGEIFLPLGLGTTVKAGHFYSMMGYESPMAPENFFYSHTWSMTHGEPMTFTGVVVNQQVTQRLSAIIGVTGGWDIWDSPRGSCSILTGFKWVSNDRNAELAFTIQTGNAHSNEVSQPYPQGDRTNYSLVYSRQLSPRWKWAIQHDLGFEQNVNEIWNTQLNPGAGTSTSYVNGQWASIVNYLYYTINDCWSVGGRFEWFQDTHNSRIGGLYPYGDYWQSPYFSSWTSGQNYYNFTLGLNWKPTSCITLRPEIRWDWSDVERNVGYPDGSYQSYGMFSNFRSKNLFTVGLEGYIKF